MTSRTQLEGMIELYEIRLERLQNLITVLSTSEALDITATLPVGPRDLILKAEEAIRETNHRIVRHKQELADISPEPVGAGGPVPDVTAPPTGLAVITPDFMPEEQIPEDTRSEAERDQEEEELALLAAAEADDWRKGDEAPWLAPTPDLSPADDVEPEEEDAS